MTITLVDTAQFVAPVDIGDAILGPSAILVEDTRILVVDDDPRWRASWCDCSSETGSGM